MLMWGQPPSAVQSSEARPLFVAAVKLKFHPAIRDNPERPLRYIP
jgi:hypothetical protein